MKRFVFFVGALACSYIWPSNIFTGNIFTGNISRAEAQHRRGDVRIGLDMSPIGVGGNMDTGQWSASLGRGPLFGLSVHGRVQEHVLVGGTVSAQYLQGARAQYDSWLVQVQPELEFNLNPREDAVVFVRVGALFGINTSRSSMSFQESLQLGVELAGGVHFFVADKFSLSPTVEASYSHIAERSSPGVGTIGARPESNQLRLAGVLSFNGWF